MQITKKILDIKNFCCKSDLKPAIQGVYFNKNKIVATDSFRLVEITNKDANAETFKEETILPLQAIKATKNDKIDIQEDGKVTVTGKLTQTTTELNPTREEFPAYEAIIPTTPAVASIRINGELLGEVLEYMNQFGGLRGVTIEFREKNKPLVIRAENEGSEVLGLVMGLTE